ncbi:MAG TPA: PDZ domain-containing protein [Rhodanobacteraceae bacterium]
MKRLIFLLLLLFACAAAAAPPSASSGGEPMQASAQAAQAAAEAARAGKDAARAADEAARAGDEAARQAADAQKLAELQKRMNDLAQRMAELSGKLGDQASASALRYLADNKRGMLGIAVDTDRDGMRVDAVTPGGPAERAGLRAGDVITALNGRRLSGDDASLFEGFSKLPPGKPVRISVLRSGKALQFQATPERFQAADWQALARTAQAAARQSLAKMNSPEFRKQLDRNVEDAMRQTEKARAQIAAQWGKGFTLIGGRFWPWWGLNLASLNPQLGHYFGTDTGALVLSVDGTNYPGLESGDVITAVEGHAVAQPGDVMRTLQALPADSTAHLEVLRHGKQVSLELKVPARGHLLPPEPPAPPASPDAPVAPPPPPASKGTV